MQKKWGYQLRVGFFLSGIRKLLDAYFFWEGKFLLSPDSRENEE